MFVGEQATATKAVRLGLFAAIGAGVVALLLVLTGVGSLGSTPSRTTTWADGRHRTSGRGNRSRTGLRRDMARSRYPSLLLGPIQPCG